jgi:hypothetical protein
MVSDVFTSLLSITKGLHRDKRTERDYRELNEKIKFSSQYKDAPLFSIEFAERALGEKRKYFKKIINIETNNKFNHLIESFPDNAGKEECVFNYYRLYNEFEQYLINVGKYIESYDHNRKRIYSEDTFIIQYLKTNAIWLFIELQERFSTYGTEDVLTVEEMYRYYFSEEINDLEIKPSELGKTTIKPVVVENNFKAIKSDLPYRPSKENVLSYRDIVQHSKSLAIAEEMMVEAGIIDKDYNFISNTSKRNKSVLGTIYFLFLEKDYFNKIKSSPFKKIKSADVVRFLNNRYNTDARKQFKTFEADSSKRNELINAEYLLKNLPNKLR